MKALSFYRRFISNFSWFNQKILQQIAKRGWHLSRVENVKRYSPDLFEEMTLLVDNRTPIIFDVGANKGQSIKRFLHWFPEATILAFEPNSEVSTEIQRQIDSEQFQPAKVSVFNFALSNEYGRRRFNLSANSGHSSFYSFNKGTEWLNQRSKQLNISMEDYTTRTIEVDTTTIDVICENLKIQKIDVLKVDTQGSEALILEGANHMLRNRAIGIIILELIHSPIYDNTVNFSLIEKNLIQYGYILTAVSSGGSIISNLNFQQDVMYVSPEFQQRFQRKD